MKKPRSDSKLANLPEDQQEEISAWCKEGFAVARDLCKARLNLSVSVRGLSEWHAWYRRQEQLRSGNERVLQTLEWFRKHRPQATADEIRAATFLQLQTLHEDDPQIQLALLKEQGRDLDRKLATRRVKILEDNAAKAKAALEGLKSKGGLTAETLKTIEEAAGLL
jgi:hypothetical protein